MIDEALLNSQNDEGNDSEDISLLQKYRNNDDSIAFNKLFNKYLRYSHILANDIVKELGADFSADYIDLVDQGVFAFMIAIEKFKDGREYLKAFWRRIAREAMKNHIYEEINYRKLVSRTQMLEERAGIFNKPIYSHCFSDGIDGSDEMLMRDIVRYIYNPANGIKVKDADMFMDYLDGPTYTELSKKYNYDRKTTSKKINEIRRKIIINVLGEKI